MYMVGVTWSDITEEWNEAGSALKMKINTEIRQPLKDIEDSLLVYL